jgi:membrane protease YdiL (CAAX protease family)
MLSKLKTRQTALLIAGPALLLSTIVAFQLFVWFWGDMWGYLAGFCFYWIFWCALLPLWVAGPRSLGQLYRPGTPLFGRPAVVGFVLILLPPIMTGMASFRVYIGSAGAGIILLSLAFALVNGVLEELLWRGAYSSVFPDHFWLGYIYPAVFFGAWHLAPHFAKSSPLPGGALSFIGGSFFMGLIWGWFVWRSRSILLTTISHVLANFFGFVGFIYLNWAGG